jgi:hypothetical protein
MAPNEMGMVPHAGNMGAYNAGMAPPGYMHAPPPAYMHAPLPAYNMGYHAPPPGAPGYNMGTYNPDMAPSGLMHAAAAAARHRKRP